jgi:hypothetical protein
MPHAASRRPGPSKYKEVSRSRVTVDVCEPAGSGAAAEQLAYADAGMVMTFDYENNRWVGHKWLAPIYFVQLQDARRTLC